MRVMDMGVALAGGLLVLSAQATVAQQGPVGSFADTAVRDLVGANVMVADGSTIGEVERIVKQGDAVMAVVGVGGFLGFGEHDVALPLTEFAQAERGLTLAAYTESDLKALVAWGGDGESMPLDQTVAGAPAAPPENVLEAPLETPTEGQPATD